MAEEKEKSMNVNVDFSNFPDLLEALEEMADEDMTDRSKFIRKLVKEEWERRYPPSRKTQPKIRPASYVGAVPA